MAYKNLMSPFYGKIILQTGMATPHNNRFIKQGFESGYIDCNDAIFCDHFLAARR